MPPVRVEIIYALPEQQTILTVEVAQGTTVRQAIIASGVIERHPEINLAAADFGIWNEKVDPDYCVRDGDRIEIYRPLVADPGTMRRQRARQNASQKRRRRS
jgi:putative ubiquitin-RnfH superfamily antitoxin RatB of RatAB toxin-antitoxin module